MIDRTRAARRPAKVRRQGGVGGLLMLAGLAVSCLAATDPARAAESQCTMVKIADLPVRVVRNKLLVDGSINGRKVGVLVDTGATMTLVLRPATERLGLERHEARGYRMFGIGGESKAESVTIDEFRIGQASRKGWRILVAGEHDLGGDAALLLGEDFFDQVDVEFDLAHNAIRLFQPKGCDGVSLAYWTTEEPRIIDIDPIYDLQPRIYITVQINGQPVRAMLDSGAGASVLTRADAARLGVTPATPGVVQVASGTGLGPKQVDSWVGAFDNVVIGTEIINHPHIYFSDLYKEGTYKPIGSHVTVNASPEQPMLLGADFLRAHRVLVSHAQRKMYFTYLGGSVFAPVPGVPRAGAEPGADGNTGPKGGEK
jgi:clan AA aspartic protease (TIGR02281 family)